MKAVEREYSAAVLAAEVYRTEVVSGRARLPHPIEWSDLESAADHLPGTYLIRVFAVFEAALRSYWDTLPRTSEPPMADLIDSLASRRRVPDEERKAAHAVREDRNDMVHQSGVIELGHTLDAACRRLHTFLSRLPDDW